MAKEKTGVIDINQELEELPGLISYQEQLVEDALLEIEESKNEKSKVLSEVLIKYMSSPYNVQKAMYKKAQSEEDTKILEKKKKLSKVTVEFNRLKNQFQSVRKLASLRIEEMKHGLEYPNSETGKEVNR